jgi:formylglycine-generating enzyme required for sulfatase activity
MPSNGSRNKTPTRPQGACGRADLVAALADGNAVLAGAVAEFVGFDRRSPERDKQQGSELEQDWGERDLPKLPREEVVACPLAEVPFWLPVQYEPIEESEPARPAPGTPYEGWSLRPRDPPPIPPLAGWRELEPKLRRLLCLPQQSRAVDLELTVRCLSQGRFLDELPREQHRRWGPALQVIEDRSRRLIPYRLDQYLVCEALRRRLPAHALGRGIFRDGMHALRLVEGSARTTVAPPPGSIVLVLGDLGCLSIARAELCKHWLRFGRDLRARGCTPVALIPSPLERCPGRFTQVWHLIPWERPRPRDLADTLELRAERLLRLVSPAVRIEPGLLRAARVLLAPAQADAGTEADVWQHPDLIGRSAAGATLDPERARQLRAEFASLIEPELQARFAMLLRTWRGYLPEEIWFEELLNLPPAAQAAAEVVQDLPYARNYFAEFARLCDGGDVAATGSDLEWFGRVERRADLLWRDKQVGGDLTRLSYALHEQDPDYRPSADFYPALIRRLDKPVIRLAVRQRGEAIEFVVSETRPGGSHLANLTSRNGWILIEPTDPFWKSGKPPPWADDWGTDEYGHWVTFSIKDQQGNKITQRMRWIAPGTFLMGSLENEPERYDDEGPQHQVTISQGFWLFDTACTQALWQAVIGSNPSRFQGADRPVENVTWNDCQEFLKKLNKRLPGLDLSLPAEAQWEYACRAGTITPFSFGANITPEQVNYDGNYPYAGGKKGLYRQETVPVASLPPNPWGLYEMHGNVWEWTQDHWHDDYRGAPTDGSAWIGSDAGEGRVLRGGSWISFGGNVRSAHRYRSVRGNRVDFIGFRLARGQVSQVGQAGAEPAGPASGRQAERRPAQVQPGGAARVKPILLRLDVAQPQLRCALPQAPAFFIHTDRERLRFGRLTLPEYEWASAIGRDRFGLWSEITIEPSQGEPVIQRLRWIPPGRFWMGSPESEAERGNHETQHRVILSRGFWLADTACTQALWQAVMGGNPSRFKGKERPVERVSWHDVLGFIELLNELAPDGGFRLQTEAEWEYACRAGTTTAFWFGEQITPEQVNYNGNYPYAGGRQGKYRQETVDVKALPCNGWGLYQMHGNVWEWCQDWYGAYLSTVEDPTGPAEGEGRVLRGGGWICNGRLVRSAIRGHDDPGDHSAYFGFRLARGQVAGRD